MVESGIPDLALKLGVIAVPGSERRRELRRRRHRKKKLAILTRKIEKASVSEKQHIAEKLRGMTPGAEELIAKFALEGR